MLARVRDKLEELLASLQSMEKTVEARLYDAHPQTAETDVLMMIEESLDRVQFTVCELRGAIELENELESEGDISSCGPRGRVSCSTS